METFKAGRPSWLNWRWGRGLLKQNHFQWTWIANHLGSKRLKDDVWNCNLELWVVKVLEVTGELAWFGGVLRWSRQASHLWVGYRRQLSFYVWCLSLGVPVYWVKETRCSGLVNLCHTLLVKSSYSFRNTYLRNFHLTGTILDAWDIMANKRAMIFILRDKQIRFL